MRFFEISSGLRVPVSEEEQLLLDRAIAKKQVRHDDLNEREQEVARLMVSRGLLHRRKNDDGMFYEPNDAADLWRF
jgi:hypothetical protein